MSDLTDFLLARIAEREADPWWPDLDIAGSDRAVGAGESAALEAERNRWRSFVLAECEAKRRIVERFTDDPWCVDGGYVYIDFALAALALPYADHPDYREEWRPWPLSPAGRTLAPWQAARHQAARRSASTVLPASTAAARLAGPTRCASSSHRPRQRRRR